MTRAGNSKLRLDEIRPNGAQEIAAALEDVSHFTRNTPFRDNSSHLHLEDVQVSEANFKMNKKVHGHGPDSVKNKANQSF